MNEIIPHHIQFPADITFQPDLALLIYRPRGVLNEESVNRAIALLGDLEAAMTAPFNRFTDTLEADAVDLNFRSILHISLYRRLSYAGRLPIKSALLATDGSVVHYAKLHKVLTQGSPIHVKIFQDRDQAAQWLGVPVERLTKEGRDPD